MVLVTPIHKSFRPFGRETTGDLLTMVINHDPPSLEGSHPLDLVKSAQASEIGRRNWRQDAYMVPNYHVWHWMVLFQHQRSRHQTNEFLLLWVLGLV